MAKTGRPTKEDSVRRRYEQAASGEIKPKQTRPKRSAQMKVQTKPGEMSAMIIHARNLQNMARWKIDRRNPDELAERMDQYLTYCIENNMRPTVESMALAYGVDRATIFAWKRGEYGMPESCAQIIRNGCALMNDIMTQCLVDGKINPVSAFFLLKNNHGYRDQTETVVTVQNPYAETKETDVRNKYLEGVPGIEAEGSVE